MSPQGLRISWLLEEVHRGRYLIFREVEMRRDPFSWSELASLLESLEILRHDITLHTTAKEVKSA